MGQFKVSNRTGMAVMEFIKYLQIKFERLLGMNAAVCVTMQPRNNLYEPARLDFSFLVKYKGEFCTFTHVITETSLREGFEGLFDAFLEHLFEQATRQIRAELEKRITDGRR